MFILEATLPEPQTLHHNVPHRNPETPLTVHVMRVPRTKSTRHNTTHTTRANTTESKPQCLPQDNFKLSFTLVSKCFASFPHGTCSLSVSRAYLALEGHAPPPLRCTPKQRDSTNARRTGACPNKPRPKTGFSPSLMPRSRGLGSRRHRDSASPGHNAAPESTGTAFHRELCPLHSPLLRASSLVSFASP